MVRAVWNGAVLAVSDETVRLEGNHYFPPESLAQEYFQPSATHSTCPWKGQASYLTVTVDGRTNPDAAWYYSQPRRAAAKIRGYVAFWHGVKIESDGVGPRRVGLLSRLRGT